MASEFIIESCIPGYHVHQLKWTIVIGALPSCRREPSNANNPFNEGKRNSCFSESSVISGSTVNLLL